jgi:hypothetical protein
MRASTVATAPLPTPAASNGNEHAVTHATTAEPAAHPKRENRPAFMVALGALRLPRDALIEISVTFAFVLPIVLPTSGPRESD